MKLVEFFVKTCMIATTIDWLGDDAGKVFVKFLCGILFEATKRVLVQ